MKNYLKTAIISTAFVSTVSVTAQEQAAPAPAQPATPAPAPAQPAPAPAPAQAAPAQTAPAQAPAQAAQRQSANPVSARTTGSDPLANFPPMLKGHVPGMSKQEQHYPRDIYTSYGHPDSAYNPNARTVVVINGVRY